MPRFQKRGMLSALLPPSHQGHTDHWLWQLVPDSGDCQLGRDHKPGFPRECEEGVGLGGNAQVGNG